MTISIDRTQWPKSSQKFGAANYDDRALHYENLAYRCRKCEASFVFTAEAQKSAYEIQKKNTSWLPKLCATCQENLEKFRAEDCEYQLRWNRNQDDLKVNQEFLQRWLFITKGLISCGKGNPGMVAMLARRIAELSEAKPNDTAV